MSAKDQIKQIVDYFKKEPQLRDKTDGMAEGLMLGANLADEANERSMEIDGYFKSLQQEYTENGNGSQSTAEIIVARDGEEVINDRLNRDFGKVKNDFSQILKPSIRIDVTNPPSSTGLLPYDVNESIDINTNRLQAIFDYIEANDVTYKENDMTLYTGYSFTVYFPKRIYIFDKTINALGRYLDFKADRAIIQTTHAGTVFKTTGANGWQLKASGFTFDRTGSAFVQENNNLEAGYTKISDCWFIDVKGYAVYLNKKSSIGTIEHCKFHKCDYVLYHENIDRMNFDYNWVSEKERWLNRDASIISKGNRLVLEKNLFVPYPPLEGIVESAYVNAYGSVQSKANHYGAEPGSKTIINVLKNPYTYTASGGSPYIIEVEDSTDLNAADDYTVIRLFSLPNRLNVRNNSGLPDNTVLAKWGSGVDQLSEINRFSSNKPFFKIDIGDNIGNMMNKYAPLSLIPSNLKIFMVNKIELTHFNSDLVPRSKEIKETDKKMNVSNLDTRRSYLVNASVTPQASTAYVSNYVGILSFKVYYDGAYKAEAVLTALQDLPGGPPSISESCDVKVVFTDTGNKITSNLDYKKEVQIQYGDRCIIGELRIKDLFESAPIQF